MDGKACFQAHSRSKQTLQSAAAPRNTQGCGAKRRQHRAAQAASQFRAGLGQDSARHPRMSATHSKADVDRWPDLVRHPAPPNFCFFAGYPTPGVSARRVVMQASGNLENLDSKTLPSTRPDWSLPNGALGLREKFMLPWVAHSPTRSRNFVPTLAVGVKGCARSNSSGPALSCVALT